MANRIHSFKLYPQGYSHGCWLACTHSLNIHQQYGPHGTANLPTHPVNLWQEHQVIYKDEWLGPNQGIKMEGHVLREFAEANSLGWDGLNGSTFLIERQIAHCPVMVAGKLDATLNLSHFFIIHGIYGATVHFADPLPVGRGNYGKGTFDQIRAASPGIFQYMFWKK